MLYPIILASATVALAGVIFKKSLRDALRSCFDWMIECCRWCDNWEIGTYSSTSNLTIGSDPTDRFSVREFIQSSKSAQSPTVTPEEEIPLNEFLETVEEERSSQISTESSQQAVELAADSIAEICGSTLSVNTGKARKSDKKKTGSTESSPSISLASRQQSPSLSKSKKQKKKTDHVKVNIEEEDNSFFLVKERKNRKSNSPEKLAASTSATPEKTSPKPSPLKKNLPRIPSPDIQPYKPKYTEKPSRQVDSSISYAQVASTSAIVSAAALFELKEPEPPRPTTIEQSRQILDSSESKSGSPVIFQTTSIVHRVDVTESENSRASPEKQRLEIHPEQVESNTGIIQSTVVEINSPKKEELQQEIKGNSDKTVTFVEERKLLKGESEEVTEGKSILDDDLSPIDSSERSDSRGDVVADDEFSESTEEIKTTVPTSSKHSPESEIYSGEKQGESEAEIRETSTSQNSQSSIRFGERNPFKEDFIEDYVATKGKFVPPASDYLRSCQSTIADINSDILDNEVVKDSSTINLSEGEDRTTDDEENLLGINKPPPLIAQPPRYIPEKSTETEILYSGEQNSPSESGTNIGIASTSQVDQCELSSVDSSSVLVVPINHMFIKEYITSAATFHPNVIELEKYEDQEKKRIALIKAGILPPDPVEFVKTKFCSDFESLPRSKSDEISSRFDLRPNTESSRSELADETGVAIEINYCSGGSTDLSLTAKEELGLLRAQEQMHLLRVKKDISEDSLEIAARQRNISCSTTEDQKSELEDLPVEVPSDGTSEDLSDDDSEENREKKIKRKPTKIRRGKRRLSVEKTTKSPVLRRSPKKTQGEEAGPSLEQTNPAEESQNPPIESLVSEEIQEEKKFIQEEPDVENQAVYKPDFTKFVQTGAPENMDTFKKEHQKVGEMPLKAKPDTCDFSKKHMEKLEQRVQVRVLTLNNEEFKESLLYRLEKKWVIEFRLGPTLFGRKIDIYCNFPEKENGRLKEFNRTQYQCLAWKHDGDSENSDDTALYAQIECSISGSFHYYFIDNSTKSICGSGYFLVDPEITYGVKEHLPLDCIQCQTVISKHLGYFSTWESKLRVSKETGYNMIHFTPVQELGASNSAYCLNDQLKLNPSFEGENGNVPSWEELKHLINKMRTEWKVTSICDIVLNHTANESPWIRQHTEATYNCQNCKYMRPAFLLDAALGLFNEDVKGGMYETRGIPPIIDSEDHLNAMRYHLKETVLKELKLHELFICDVNSYVSKFMEMARQHQPGKDAEEIGELNLIQDPDYRRLASSVDMDLAMKIYNIYRPGCFDEDSRLRRSCEEFKRKLDSLNQTVIDKIQDHLNTAVENIISGVRYWRVQPDGPKLKEITVQNPLVTRYFTDFGKPKDMKEYEEIMYSDEGRFLMAHNGWIMDSDPLVNFARPESNVYIRRELIAWGDSVKLRYGDKPSDSPFLWDMMRRYVELTASIFDGVRLDNCHSTPLEVAEYLMDCARKVRPDLYVVAELFTNSDQKDNIFVNRLGITSLIREAMSACDSHDQGRLVYRYGGIPVGSFYQPDVRPLVPTIAHALFFDLTHDNPSPIGTKSVFDLLPSAAMVNMACCGTGSNRGYDELVPHQISVVDETREYSEWIIENTDDIPKYTSINCGINKAKKALNDLHFKLGCDGFNQVYVDQMDQDIVAITRHCPKTHRSYILVAFTAFRHPNSGYQRSIKPLRVEGVLDEIVLEATLSHVELSNGGSKYAHSKNFKKDDHYINGYSEYELHMKQNIQLRESEILEETASGNPHEIALNFKNFQPGSIVIIKVSLEKKISEAISEVRKLSDQFSYKQETDLKRIIKKLGLRDLNRVLFRCDQEERDEQKGFDTYDIPGYGKLVYAGLQGFISLLSKIRPINDLGHPMCGNIRQGDWMIDYIYQRLKLDEGTVELGNWIEDNTKTLKIIPKYLKPAYFDLIFTGIYVLLLEHSYNSMSSFVKNGSMFVKALSMGSIQLAAYVRSADLPPLSPNLTPPKPPMKKDENGKETQICVSLSAGLPHFSVGYTRNWGRDTFIALRGLLLLTDRYQEARYHILAYAACLRHGLIPNLLDGGRKSRYNCRDAVWWWLYCIRCYVEEVADGVKILEDKVSRIFPTDDSLAQQPGAMDQSLQDVMQEALNRHFQGVAFRERNAGWEIDQHMTDNGFNNQIGVHPETGFVFGGNVDNCGTWMDKMGSSEKAGTKGKPATPRDGSACEIVGLSKCVISWLAAMHDKSLYKYGGVERTHSNGKTTNWSFTFWANKIQENFEKYFWVNEKPTEGEIKPNLINKRGIYKDCYGATQQWTDYQLRCNFPIVMVVAPELFNPQHAWTALQKVEQHLLGPLGIKTLDPDDWAYRADYDNSNDSEDATVAQGFNYHQGPEWLWPVGFFLRAKLYFAAKNNKLKEAIAEIKYTLSRHFTELQTSDWRGLPELTNNNGSYCQHSCSTQAWSMSCILEVLHDLQRIESSIS